MKKIYFNVFLAVCFSVFAFAGNTRISLLKNELHTAKDTVKKIELLCKLSFEYYSTNTDSGIYFAQEALSLAHATNDARGIVLSSSRLGNMYEAKGKFDSASVLYRYAMEIGEKNQIKDALIEVYNLLGSYNINVNPDKALEYQLKALHLSEEIRDTNGIAAALNNIGNIYLVTKNYDKALEQFLLSYTKRKNMEKQSHAGILSDIGNAYFYKNSLDSAFSYYRASFEISREKNDKQGMGYSIANMGLVYLEKDEYTKAIEAFSRSLRYREDVNNNLGISNSLLNLSQCYLEKGEPDKALPYAKRNYELSKKFGLKHYLVKATNLLVEIYTTKHEYKTALYYMQMYNTTKDSLYNEEQQRHLIQSQVFYETEHKEAENKFLKENQAKQDAVIQQQAILTISISVLFIVTFIFLVLLYRSNTAKQKANTMLNKQNAVIEQTKHQLEELHTAKDKLFSVVTHDLRGPVTSLWSMLTVLSEEHFTQEEQQKHLKTATISSNHIVQLLNNILLWSRSQWYEFQVRPETFTIHQLVNEKILSSSTELKHKNISITNSISEQMWVHADFNMIDMVLRNLISNAIKFTPKDGTIAVLGSERERFAYITVQDSGRGMSEEQQRSLFGLQNLSTPGTESEAGIGVGLILSKEYIEKNGGTISVQSEIGKGSAFTFTIPLATEL